jgi:hypothetical protein
MVLSDEETSEERKEALVGFFPVRESGKMSSDCLVQLQDEVVVVRFALGCVIL